MYKRKEINQKTELINTISSIDKIELFKEIKSDIKKLSDVYINEKRVTYQKNLISEHLKPYNYLIKHLRNKRNILELELFL